jgi:hypothetical protein
MKEWHRIRPRSLPRLTSIYHPNLLPPNFVLFWPIGVVLFCVPALEMVSFEDGIRIFLPFEGISELWFLRGGSLILKAYITQGAFP